MTLQLLANVLLPLLIIVIMYGLGLSLTKEDFRRVSKYPRAVLLGLLCQVVLLPIVAFGLCYGFSLAPTFAIGLMLIASSPGGPTSILFSKFSNGDVALNMTLTAVNTMVAPLTMPLIVGFAISHFAGQDQSIEFPVRKVFEVLVLVLIPALSGMATNAWKPELARRLDRPGQILSVAGLVIVIAGTFAKEGRFVIDNFGAVGWAVIAFNILSLAVSYGLPKLMNVSRPQAIAIAFEVGIHNGALALFVALTSLGSTTIGVPAAIYSMFMYVTGVALSVWFRRTRPS